MMDENEYMEMVHPTARRNAEEAVYLQPLPLHQQRSIRINREGNLSGQNSTSEGGDYVDPDVLPAPVEGEYAEILPHPVEGIYVEVLLDPEQGRA